MKTTIIRTDIWKDDELFKLHLDSKLLYLFILSSPERGNSHLFPWSKRQASNYTGITETQVDVAMKQLIESGFVSVYGGYIAILKEHFSVTRNRYSQQIEEEVLSKLPEDVYAYFIDKKPIPHEVKKPKVKKDAKMDEVKKFINSQNGAIQKALLDFVEDRVARKRPPTVGAVKLWVNKLNKMYPNQYDKQVLSLEQSIERGWTGLFEVKVDKSPAGGGKFM